MKNIKLLTFLMIIILCTQFIHTQNTQQNHNKQSLLAYLYSYVYAPKLPELAIPTASDSHKKVIIFDLDGVLCKTNDLQAFYEIGMATVLPYIVQYGLPSSQKLFQALEKTRAVTTFHAYNNEIALPQIMVDWQTNAQQLPDIQKSMIQHIMSLPITITQKNLFINTVIMMTTPEKFIASRQTIPAAIELAQLLKKLGYRLYILSNWDPFSFNLFQAKFPELFIYENLPLFDGIMTSGQVGLVKPNHAIFELCLKKFNIKKSHAVFIDDTIENIQAAENLGITSIHCKHHDIADVKEQLIKIIKK